MVLQLRIGSIRHYTSVMDYALIHWYEPYTNPSLVISCVNWCAFLTIQTIILNSSDALRCGMNAQDLTHVLHLIGFKLHDAFIYVLYRRLLEFFLVFYLNLKSICVRFLIAQRSRCLSMFFYFQCILELQRVVHFL